MKYRGDREEKYCIPAYFKLPTAEEMAEDNRVRRAEAKELDEEMKKFLGN